MKALHIITWILIIVGALNWGLVGLLDGFNLVEKILGSAPSLVKIVYILVGVSALVELFTHWSHCKYCGKQNMPTQM